VWAVFFSFKIIRNKINKNNLSKQNFEHNLKSTKAIIFFHKEKHLQF
jgi:hypothetical protein